MLLSDTRDSKAVDLTTTAQKASALYLAKNSAGFPSGPLRLRVQNRDQTGSVYYGSKAGDDPPDAADMLELKPGQALPDDYTSDSKDQLWLAGSADGVACVVWPLSMVEIIRI